MTDVFITITGTQQMNNDLETVVVTANGTMELSGGRALIVYDESAELGGKKAELRIENENIAVLKRGGDRLIIKNGGRRLCGYTLPQGKVTVGISGKSIINRLTENGGSVTLNYTIDFGADVLSENKVEISVKVVNICRI